MTKETTELIEKLAAKLGTTAEQLWGVLIRQAPISSATELAVGVAAFLAAIWLARITARQSKLAADGDLSDAVPLHVLGAIGAGVATVICCIIVIVGLCNMGTIISGFVNPEYWALKELLP